MSPAALAASLRANPAVVAIVDRLPELGVEQAVLTGGCLAQTWWNVAAGRAPDGGVRDYDLFYWDPDLSWEAEDRVIRRAAALWGAGVGWPGGQPSVSGMVTPTPPRAQKAAASYAAFEASGPLGP